MKLLIKKQQESHENAKICYICQEKFENIYLRNKKFCKVGDHCHYTKKYRGSLHSICNLKYRVPKEIALVSHKGSNYDYNFIIEKIAQKLKKNFFGLGENSEKNT